MTSASPARFPHLWMMFFCAYTAASLLHFVHNAEFLSLYPNMPPSFTRAGVYASWLGIAAVGATGLALFRLGFQKIGLWAVCLFSVFGFDGLLHYALAPMSDHSFAMNATILLEVAAAALLLVKTMQLLMRLYAFGSLEKSDGQGGN